jgi:hypothetical protein
VEFETHGRIASAVAKTRENRVSSNKNRQISSILAQLHRPAQLKTDRLLEHRQQIADVRDFLVEQQDEWVVEPILST